MSALKEVFAEFRVAFDDTPLRHGAGAVDQLAAGLGRLGQLAIVTAAAEGVRRVTTAVLDFTLEMQEAADGINDTAQFLNTSTDALQRWRYAAQVATGSSENADAAMQGLQRTLAQASNGNAQANNTFRRLGVSLRDNNGEFRDTGAIFGDVARAIAATENPTERAGLSLAAFGRGGQRIGPLLARGQEGIAELSAEFERFGGGLDENAIERFDQLGDSLDQLELAMFSFKGFLASILAPGLQLIVDVAAQVAAGFAYLERNTNIIKAAIIALGVVLVAVALITSPAWVPLLITFGLMALAIAAVVLVIEDLVTAFEGGRSVSGAFWQTIVRGVESTINAIRELFGMAGISLTQAGPKTEGKGGRRRGGGTETLQREEGVTTAESQARHRQRLEAERLRERLGIVPGSGEAPAPDQALRDRAERTPNARGPGGLFRPPARERVAPRTTTRTTTNHFNINGMNEQAAQRAIERALRRNDQEIDDNFADVAEGT